MIFSREAPATGSGFASADRLVDLDAVARRYGVRPSQIVGLRDPFAAWDFDQAAAYAGMVRENQAIQQATTTTGQPSAVSAAPGATGPATIQQVRGIDQPVIAGTVDVRDDPRLSAWLDEILPSVDLEDLLTEAQEPPQ